MAKTKYSALNERLRRVSEELVRTREALLRSTARNAELRDAVAKLSHEITSTAARNGRTAHRLADKAASGTRTTERRTIEPATYGLARGLASPRLRRVIDYIEASLAERLDVASLASVAGMSPAHFATRFKQATGLPPHEAVIRLRLARSKECLADESQTIAAISAQLGFSSQAHFTTVFRQRFGVTPAGWRETRLRPLQRNQNWQLSISEDTRRQPKNSESHGKAAGGLIGKLTEPPYTDIGASRPGTA
jgi:AraC-like DNA-binding protein